MRRNLIAASVLATAALVATLGRGADEAKKDVTFTEVKFDALDKAVAANKKKVVLVDSGRRGAARASKSSRTSSRRTRSTPTRGWCA